MDAPGDAPVYLPPVDRLLSLGEASRGGSDGWPDYPAQYELRLEDVPELIRMATDEHLLWEEEGPALWAPVHAWRALGQLRAEAAVEPLAALLCEAEYDDHDWALEELPVTFGLIGRVAIPTLARLMRNDECGVFAQVAAARSLESIAASAPDARAECIAALVHRLSWHARNDPILNGFLISYLLELGATEASSMIESAFAADDVDLSIVGDWEDAQVALGLLPTRRTPRAPLHWVREPGPASRSGPNSGAAEGKRQSQKRKAAKAKRKAAAQSRKRNRRRK
jgi:hypothetical protein